MLTLGVMGLQPKTEVLAGERKRNRGAELSVGSRYLSEAGHEACTEMYSVSKRKGILSGVTGCSLVWLMEILHSLIVKHHLGFDL